MTTQDTSLEFVDSLILGCAVSAYIQHLENTKQPDDKILRDGLLLWKNRYLNDFRKNLEQYLADPFVETGKAPTLNLVVQKIKSYSQARRILVMMPGFMSRFVTWLNSHSTEFIENINARARPTLLSLRRVGFSDDPVSQLAALAPIRFLANGREKPQKWVDIAAAAAGVMISPVEDNLRDLGDAHDLGASLHQIDAQIAVTPVGSEQEAELNEEREALLDTLGTIAEDSPNPGSVYSAAVAGQRQLDDAGRIAQEFRLTEEQEQIIRSEGPILVAAGAGSGKTGTTVAWVAQASKNLRIDPERIGVFSFTRAASAEVANRIDKKVGVKGTFLGRTTHALARSIIKDFGNDEEVRDIKLRYMMPLMALVNTTDQADKLWKIALQQIQMEMSEETIETSMKDDLGRLMDLLRVLDTATRGSNANNFIVSLLAKAGMEMKKKDPSMLSRGQLEAILKFQKNNRSPQAAKDEIGFVSNLINKYSQVKKVALEIARTAAPAAKKSAPKRSKSKYSKIPANQRFNIGADKLIDPETNTTFKPGQLKLTVENFKNNRMSVEDAYKSEEVAKIEAAAYDAYEWLKLNDREIGPAMDYTDQLSIALEILEKSERARKIVQRKFDMLVVDEAQDLNEIQFSFFNILGEKSRIFAYVGDDKQSIYGFRGAKPSNFIDRSKQSGVKTILLTMNFRSGSAIVDAANTLIAHNEDQVPMVCKAHPTKGAGQIQSVATETHEGSATYVATQIKNAMDSGESADDFGIIVRNNAEMDAYEVALLTMGIPFRKIRGDVGFFDKKNVRELLAWMRLASGGSVGEINDAVLRAHSVPGFFLDRKFAEILNEKVPKGQSYLDYLKDGGSVYDEEWRDRKNVDPYVEAMLSLRASPNASSEDLIYEIFEIVGSGGKSFKEVLLSQIDNQDVVEEGDEEVKEEDKLATAMAPFQPLLSIAATVPAPDRFMDTVMKLKKASEKTQKKSPSEAADFSEPAVLLGTAHSWKGLERKRVFVSMAGGVFPHMNEPNPEERRLAYVAITRGEQQVTIMSPSISYRGKSEPPSPFLSEACIPPAGAEYDEAAESEVLEAEEANSMDMISGKVASIIMFDEPFRMILGNLLFGEDE